MSTHYEVLGVPADADGDSIKKAYVEAARRFHPDALAHAPDEQRSRAESRMQEINAAWSVLRNPVLRREYDRQLRGEPTPAWRQQPAAAPRTRPVGAEEVRRMAHGPSAAAAPVHGGSWLRYWPAFLVGGLLLVIFVFTAYAASTDGDEPVPVSLAPAASPFVEGGCVVLVSSAGRVTPVPAECSATGASVVRSITDTGRPCPAGSVPFDVPASEQRLCLQEQ